MKLLMILPAAGLALALQGCEKKTSIYADAPQVHRAAAAPGEPAPYIGRWATTAAECNARSWTLTATHLLAPDGASCDIVGPDATPAGYSANAMCKGPKLLQPTSGRIVMTLTGPAPGNSLSITEVPIGPATLVRCAA